jgi:protein phosphatase methylesterase 1
LCIALHYVRLYVCIGFFFTVDLQTFMTIALAHANNSAHGLTRCADESDLSSHGLVEDVVAVIAKVFASSSSSASPPRKQRIVLAGHSLGGSLVVRVAAALEAANANSVTAADTAAAAAAAAAAAVTVAGVVVVDVVEGTAIDALDGMDVWLAK